MAYREAGEGAVPESWKMLFFRAKKPIFSAKLNHTNIDNFSSKVILSAKNIPYFSHVPSAHVIPPIEKLPLSKNFSGYASDLKLEF